MDLEAVNQATHRNPEGITEMERTARTRRNQKTGGSFYAFDFAMLHARHASWALLNSVRPPFDQATIWSICSSSSANR